jgi:hypothetical protein
MLGSFCCDRFSGLSPFSILHSPFSILLSLALSLASMMTTESPASPARAGADDDESDTPPETPQQKLSALCADIDFNDDLPQATSSITPGGWQAAVRHDTVVSRRRRRHATAASSDFFCVPFGGGGAPAGASADSAENAGCSVRPSSVIVKGTHAASLSRSHPAARALPT